MAYLIFLISFSYVDMSLPLLESNHFEIKNYVLYFFVFNIEQSCSDSRCSIKRVLMKMRILGNSWNMVMVKALYQE